MYKPNRKNADPKYRQMAKKSMKKKHKEPYNKKKSQEYNWAIYKRGNQKGQ